MQAYTNLKKDLFFTSIFYRRTFYLRGAGEAVLPFFHMKKASAAKNSEVPALFWGVCDLSSPVVGLHSVGRLTSGRFCRVCLGTGDFLRPQGAIPSGFYRLRGVGFIAWRLGAPKRGMPTGPKVFLALPDSCGLRPCDRTHLKNGLVPYSCVCGTHR